MRSGESWFSLSLDLLFVSVRSCIIGPCSQPVVDNLDGVLAQLKARGVDVAYGPFPARDKIRSNFIVRDNEGNLIQFFGK